MVTLLRYTEKIDWILDKNDTPLGKNELYQQNIEFVHSLGLKCDCVGWCSLDLSHPKTREILDKIAVFCRENGWTARAYYTRSYTDVESDWYELVTSDFKDSTISDILKMPAENGPPIFLCVLRAFHELASAPKSYGPHAILVPERFCNACLRRSIDDLDFCWAQDKGKYEAEQYFHIYAKHTLPKIATSIHLDELDPERIQRAGGWLPTLAEVIHKFQHIDLPDCYLRSDLPERGIVQAHVVRKYQIMMPASLCEDSAASRTITREVTAVGRNTILIHKDTAEILLREKALPASALRPAPVVDALPGGYVWEECVPAARPSTAYRNEMLAAYEKLKAAPRPARSITEKDALKVLRTAKKERKDEFQKSLPRAKAAELAEADYAPMAAYYLVSNGGFLSDEYELLSYSQSVCATSAFYHTLRTEELLSEKPEGIVIAQCPDGDAVLLCKDNSVLRFSHEAPEVIDRWDSLPQFIVDAVSDGE